jgi:hypothetical protein
MTAMSTPVTQLPAQPASHVATTSEEDPMVNDVISEMESEFQHTQNVATQPPVQQSYMPSQPPPAYPVAPPAAPQQFNMHLMSSMQKPYFDLPIAKRAAICAIVALLIFYPFELGFVYEKVPMLARMQPYERAIRALLLAVVLYALMWKFNI